MPLAPKPLHRFIARIPRPLQPLRDFAFRASRIGTPSAAGSGVSLLAGDRAPLPVGDRVSLPVGDRANADLARELLQEMEDQQPSPLLMNIATGFPSALLCVLAAGVLAGALAGREVSVTPAPATAALPAQAPVAVAAAAMAGRHARLQELELQALLPAMTAERLTVGSSSSSSSKHSTR